MRSDIYNTYTFQTLHVIFYKLCYRYRGDRNIITIYIVRAPTRRSHTPPTRLSPMKQTTTC